MTIEDLNTGNALIEKINRINVILADYNTLRIVGGTLASAVTFEFAQFGTIRFEDAPGSFVVDPVAASFITSLTSYKGALQSTFDALGTSGGGGEE